MENIEYIKAPFFQRFLAFIIDAVFLALLGGLLGFLGGTPGAALSVLVPILYNGFFYQKFSASPGKYFLDMKVVKTETGAKPTYFDALVRDGVGKTISAFLLCVGYLMAAFRDDGAALHDLMAKTKVLQRKKQS